MAIITLFDKSFVQSLTVDESVWFDRFFYAVVCPIFYVETLADLSKKPRGDRTADGEVRIIADKFPEMSGTPCADHFNMAVSNILGVFQPPMDGRIPRSGGRNVWDGNRVGIVFDESPEMAAFRRWQNQEFYEVERRFAAGWRAALDVTDLTQIAAALRGAGLNTQSCKTLADVKHLADELIQSGDKAFDRLRFAVEFFGIGPQHHKQIVQNWSLSGKPPLHEYAPYAAFVLTIEVFFHIALAAGLISPDRASNRTDIAYLFYLPFCMTFVSSDRLHRRTASLFMRPDQEFVWGIDLKADLARLDAHYKATLSESERERGLIGLVHAPPADGGYLVTKLWERHLRPEALHEGNVLESMSPEAQAKLVNELTALTQGAPLPGNVKAPDDDAVEAVSVERRISKRKGNWWQLPKDYQDLSGL
jgi:hypothetical protein